ncbi:MAG: pyruvate formate lyase family protein, partial [Chloroflexota bacterium]
MVSTAGKEQLRRQIDFLPLSQRLERLRRRYFEERPRVDAQRLKFAMQSWKETEGQPIEVRCAKKLKAILEGIPTIIHDGDLMAGSQSRFLRGCAPYVDWNGVYFDKVVEGRQVTFGGPAHTGTVSDEDYEICKNAAAYYRGWSPAEAAQEVARMVYGEWYDDAMAARTLPLPYEQQPYLMGVAMWDKALAKGMKGIIAEVEEAEAQFHLSNDSDPEKLFFWQAVNTSCSAIVTLAHRYAQRARESMATEQDDDRRKQLERIAEACDWVPENPARNLFEAVQALRLVHMALLMENGRNSAHVGRIDQLLDPWFRKDVEDGSLTVEEASEIVGDFITYLARLEQIKDFRGRESNQSTQITHLTLGGTDKDGNDASNEVTYLILHLLGLLKYAEPHATVRLHEGTPSWLLMKSLETNQKVNGIP